MNVFIKYYQGKFGSATTNVIHLEKGSATLVFELRKKIQEVFNIPPSNQRLSTNIVGDCLVLLTNEWPLSFFYLKEYSIIYLEFIQEVNKQEEAFKKVLSLTKSKYLKSLGFFSHFSTSLQPIRESKNEAIYESIVRSKIQTDSFGNEDEIDMFISAVKNNNINEVKELFDNNSHININHVAKNGWAAIHLASYYGYTEILLELIYHKVDANMKNKDNWTALHLACYKGREEIVKVLMNVPDIDVDCMLDGVGTPLHIACKRNYVKIVSILLFKANIDIINSNGKTALDLCNDKNIAKLFRRRKKKKQQVMDNDITNYQFFKTLSFIPPKPPKTLGFIQKMGMFVFNYNIRFLEVDAVGGSLKRYISFKDYPNTPHEVIPLRDISICKKINSLYYSKSYYYFELIYEQRQVYRLISDESCNKWIETLNAAIIYAKFFWKLLQESNNEVTKYFSKLKEEVQFIEFEKSIDEEYKQNQLNTIQNSKKNSMNGGKGNSDANNTNNKNSKLEKKKERRKNPHTNSDQDCVLLDDATDQEGITFTSFEILGTLGAGTFGKVFKVKLKTTGKIYAMKVINKKYLIRNQQLRYAVTECNVLKQINHPFIIKLHYAFQTPDFLYMILDYCPGGDLSYHIVKNLFEEEEAQIFIAELILAIEHLHSYDIIYRDLKPENILVDVDGHIKLADFGLAKENVADNKTTQSFCGSPAYLSPEMVNRRGVGKSADIYGIGAVLYEMISGTPPFYANDLGTMYRNISKSKLLMHDYFSEELQSLLKKLLNRDPKVRIGLNSKDDIKSHEFFKGLDWDKLYRREIDLPINLNEYKVDINESSSTIKKEEKEDQTEKIFRDIDYNENNSDLNRVKNFTFVRSPKAESFSDQ